MPVNEAAAHTVQCYRNSTKCKVCGEVILKEKKKEHLSHWRNNVNLLDAIKNDHEEQVSLHFDHGMDCNMQFMPAASGDKSKKVRAVPDAKNQNREDWTPMHYASENGCLNVILTLVSRGAGIDPTDTFERTPLMIAIENNKSAVARSLIELGADIETTDVYGKTPLMYACKVASKEIVELLIKCKADIRVVNKVGDSAVTMA
jgi:ankyrin repeat protein